MRFVETWGDTFRYSKDQGWLAYNNLFWEPSEEAAGRAAMITALSVAEEAAGMGVPPDTAKAILAWAKQSLSAVRIREMLSLARYHETISRKLVSFDRNNWLLNTPTGTIDLHTGQLLPHNPAHLISQITRTTYDPNAECPRWLSFIDDVTNGSPQLAFTLQQAAGYALTGDISERCVFILYGGGSNGKSCLVDTLHYILGSYAKVAPATTFANSGFSDNNSQYAMATLRGKRLVLASEGEQGAKLAESVVKQMTGDASITARLPFQGFFEFQPTFKVFYSTNHKPTIRGGDKAVWKRIRLIPFAVTIPDEKQIPNLVSLLCQEGPGILNWALEGLFAWTAMDKRMKMSEECVDAKNEYKDEEDTIQGFINDCLLLDPGGMETSSDVYTAYKEWAATNGLRQMSHARLTPLLKEKGFVLIKTTRYNAWKDVTIDKYKSSRGTEQRESRDW